MNISGPGTKATTARPRLLLLPGLDGSGELFAPLLPLIEPHLEIRVISYPDLADFDAYVEYLRGELPASGRVSLLAESFSGPLALMLMAAAPERFDAAVLSATFAHSPRPLLSRIAGWMPSVLLTAAPLYRLGLDLFGVNGGNHAEARRLSLELLQRIDRVALKHRAALLQRVDVTRLLPRIEVPILCLRARHDRVVPAWHADRLVDALPDAHCIDIDAPHLLLQTRPRVCARAILEHILGRPGTAAKSVQAAENPPQ